MLQRAAAAAAPCLCHQWVPTEPLCQLGCCFPQNARKAMERGDSSSPSQTLLHPQGSSFESPAANPGALPQQS